MPFPWLPLAIGASGLLGAAGAAKQASAQQKAGEANAELQREFAQHGIRWKVNDAKKAGLHPLYAIGAQTTSASPAYVGADPGGAAMQGFSQPLLSGALQLAQLEASNLQNQKSAQELELGELQLLDARHQRLMNSVAENAVVKMLDGQRLNTAEQAVIGHLGDEPSLLTRVFDPMSGKTLNWPTPDLVEALESMVGQFMIPYGNPDAKVGDLLRYFWNHGE